MKFFSNFYGLIMLFALLGCKKIPSEEVPANWDYGEALYFYNSTDNKIIVDKIIKNNGGYSNPRFFLISINLLINRGLAENKPELFDYALKNLIQMEGDLGHLDFIAYKQLIMHIKVNHLQSSFNFTDNNKCPSEIDNLKETHSNSSFGYQKNLNEYTYWFSLYVNSVCSTAETRAIYISSLAQLNTKKAKVEFNKINTLDNFNTDESVQFRGALCRLRDEYDGYDKKNGIYQLENAGLIKCTKKLVDE